MKGIIIAGGQGTRLRPLTYRRPKPLVPVVNRPFLEYQVALLKLHGIDDIVFATNYLADQIRSHFGDGSRFGVRMRYAVEETPLGTGGAIRNAADLFPGEAVAVFNGDILTDYDLGAVLAFHERKQALATITLQPVPSPNPFGVLVLNEDERVIAWLEPSEEVKRALAMEQNVIVTGTDLINAGFYVFHPDFIAAIPAGTKSSVERDIFPPMLAESKPVYGIAPGGFWMDLGRAEQLMAASNAILQNSVRTPCRTEAVAAGSAIAEQAQIVGLCSIGSNVIIGDHSVIESCIIMNNVKIGAHAHLRSVIVDENTVIEDGVIAEGRSAGPALVIAAGSVLRQGSIMRLG